MKKIQFFWQGVPPRSTAQTRRHTRTGQTYRTPANRRAVATLQAVVEPHAPTDPIAGPVAVTASLTFPSPRSAVAPRTKRPDADNLAKDLLDALQAAGFFADDSQVARLTVSKFDGPIPGIFVKVQTMQEKIMQTDTPTAQKRCHSAQNRAGGLDGRKGGSMVGPDGRRAKNDSGAKAGYSRDRGQR